MTIMNHIIPLIVVICLLLPIVGGFRAPSLRPAPAVATSIRTASSPGSRLYAYEVIDSIDATFVSQLTGCAGLIFAGQWYDSRPEELVAPSTPLASPSSKQVIDFTKNSESMFEDEKEVDIYRDTALRYAGYLNEVGEAFRPVVSGNLVLLSYVLAITYVLADARSKGKETFNLSANRGINGCGLAAVIDTLSFQFIASIIIPGSVINRWVTLCGYMTFKGLDIATQLSMALHTETSTVLTHIGDIDVTCDSIASTLPTVLGLALIPLIVSPIDALTEKFLDEIIRPLLVKRFPTCTLPFAENDEDGCGRENSIF